MNKYKFKFNLKIKIFVSAIFLLLDLLLIFIIINGDKIRHEIENIYSDNIYPFFKSLILPITDIFYFSLTEIITVLLIIFIIYNLVSGTVKAIRRQINVFRFISNFLLNIFIIASLYFTVFYLFWGLNYFRQPVEEKLHLIDKSKMSDERLVSYTKYYIDKTNEFYQDNFDYDEKRLNYSINFGLQKVYKLFEKKNSFIFITKQPKNLIFNFVLNYLQTTGFASPLYEAHLNSDIFPAQYPFTLAHEKAHNLGYASEAEANFIAYLVCTNSNNKFINYSGYFSIMRYFLRSLYKRSGENNDLKETYKNLYGKIKQEVIDEMNAIHEHFKKYRTFVSDISRKAYDFQLKVNKVKSGIADYGRVVNLVLQYEK